MSDWLQPEFYNGLLQAEVYGNTALDWALALLLSVSGWIALVVLRRVLLKRLAGAPGTPALWDDALLEALGGTNRLVILVAALSLGGLSLHLDDNVRTVLRSALAIALITQAGLWLNGLLGMWFRLDRERRRAHDPSTIAAMNALALVLRVALWSVVVLLVLDNLGVNVTALVAGLGVGGVAVALAVQNILGDLFASLSIALDKPFAVGDFLNIDEHFGSVEYIGLKTTRLRSLSGEQLVFSNTDLLSSRIRNYGRMYERRVVFKLGVTYQTPRHLLERIPGMIRETVEAQEQVRFDRSHFQAYGDFALLFETVYYVLAPDYHLYMDIQQAINLGIHARFEEHGIAFAYPTQTVHLVQPAGGQG